MSLRGELIDILTRLNDEEFSRLCTSLSSLMENGIIMKGHVLGQDSAYRTLTREIDGARTLLGVFGWRLEAEPLQGFVRLVDEQRRCAVRFTRDESVILVLLRLLLHERAGQASYEKDITVSIGDVREIYLQHAGDGARGFPMGALSNALRHFQRLKLVDLDRPFVSHDGATIRILPTLYAVIPPESASNASNLLLRYIEDRGATVAVDGEEGAPDNAGSEEIP